MQNKQRIAIIKGQALKYSIRRHPRARRCRVTVSREQGVVVTLPPRESLSGIDRLFTNWADWLQENVDQVGVWDGPVVREFASGSVLLLEGVPHQLKITALPSGKMRSRIAAENGIISMELPVEEVLSPRPALEKFLKKRAREVFQLRVEHWSAITGLSPVRVIVGERFTRWGSCSSRGTLSFCYRLIMAPPQVLDAIVVHELCHLKHRNHGRGFWSLLKAYIPAYQQTRQWLTENSADLQI